MISSKPVIDPEVFFSSLDPTHKSLSHALSCCRQFIRHANDAGSSKKRESINPLSAVSFLVKTGTKLHHLVTTVSEIQSFRRLSISLPFRLSLFILSYLPFPIPRKWLRNASNSPQLVDFYGHFVFDRTRTIFQIFHHLEFRPAYSTRSPFTPAVLVKSLGTRFPIRLWSLDLSFSPVRRLNDDDPYELGVLAKCFRAGGVVGEARRGQSMGSLQSVRARAGVVAVLCGVMGNEEEEKEEGEEVVLDAESESCVKKGDQLRELTKMCRTVSISYRPNRPGYVTLPDVVMRMELFLPVLGKRFPNLRKLSISGMDVIPRELGLEGVDVVQLGPCFPKLRSLVVAGHISPFVSFEGMDKLRFFSIDENYGGPGPGKSVAILSQTQLWQLSKLSRCSSLRHLSIVSSNYWDEGTLKCLSGHFGEPLFLNCSFETLEIRCAHVWWEGLAFDLPPAVPSVHPSSLRILRFEAPLKPFCGSVLPHLSSSLRELEWEHNETEVDFTNEHSDALSSLNECQNLRVLSIRFNVKADEEEGTPFPRHYWGRKRVVVALPCLEKLSLQETYSVPFRLDLQKMRVLKRLRLNHVDIDQVFADSILECVEVSLLAFRLNTTRPMPVPLGFLVSLFQNPRMERISVSGPKSLFHTLGEVKIGQNPSLKRLELDVRPVDDEFISESFSSEVLKMSNLEKVRLRGCTGLFRSIVDNILEFPLLEEFVVPPRGWSDGMKELYGTETLKDYVKENRLLGNSIQSPVFAMTSDFGETPFAMLGHILRLMEDIRTAEFNSDSEIALQCRGAIVHGGNIKARLFFRSLPRDIVRRIIFNFVEVRIDTPGLSDFYGRFCRSEEVFQVFGCVARSTNLQDLPLKMVGVHAIYRRDAIAFDASLAHRILSVESLCIRHQSRCSLGGKPYQWRLVKFTGLRNLRIQFMSAEGLLLALDSFGKASGLRTVVIELCDVKSEFVEAVLNETDWPETLKTLRFIQGRHDILRPLIDAESAGWTFVADRPGGRRHHKKNRSTRN